MAMQSARNSDIRKIQKNNRVTSNTKSKKVISDATMSHILMGIIILFLLILIVMICVWVRGKMRRNKAAQRRAILNELQQNPVFEAVGDTNTTTEDVVNIGGGKGAYSATMKAIR